MTAVCDVDNHNYISNGKTYVEMEITPSILTIIVEKLLVLQRCSLYSTYSYNYN